MFLVDSHCHLDLLAQNTQNNVDDIIARAQKADVQYILNVCVSLAAFDAVYAFAKAHDFIGASVGLHPNEQAENVTEDILLQLGQSEKVVAIGETGLDYYRSQGSLEWQRERFRTHIRAAKKLNKPLIVHTRSAKEDTIRVMREENAQEVGGVMHCFTEDWAMAKAALDLNFYISFSGIVTFKNASAIQEVAKLIPEDRILIETDAPYLAPNPFRGKQNEPAYVHHTATFLANLRQAQLANFAAQTTDNFFNLFKGAVKPYV